MMEQVQIRQILPPHMSPKERLTMGVGLHHIWVRPDVHVIADVAADQANQLRRATLRVDGLLCSL
jgi:hypothetical protein